MKTVLVFPDYCSTGFWLLHECLESPIGSTHVNCDGEDFGLPAEILIAVKYWHHTWELCQDKDYNSIMSHSYFREWMEDGKALVQAMNNFSTDYNFVYGVEEPK